MRSFPKRERVWTEARAVCRSFTSTLRFFYRYAVAASVRRIMAATRLEGEPHAALRLDFMGRRRSRRALGVGAGERADKSLKLTIYNSNLALVEHVRPLNVGRRPAPHRVRRRVGRDHVADRQLREPGAHRHRAELRLRLADAREAHGESRRLERVRIVRTNPGTGEETEETAEVLSTVGGVVLRSATASRCCARTAFRRASSSTRCRRTCARIRRCRCSRTPRQPVNGDVTLAYLTRGLSWNADYVAVFEEAQGNVSLQGWITLTNNSGTTFANANAQLVAGDINVVGSEAEWWQIYNFRRNNANVRRAGVEASGREQLADYYVYPLAQATTIANNQTKQVSFLSAERVRADRGYEQTFYDFLSQDEPVSAEVRVRFSNSQAPAGSAISCRAASCASMRATRAASRSSSARTASATRARAPILALKIGDAFDVTIQPTLRQTTRASRRATDYDMSYLVRNARSAADHRDDPPGQSLALQRGRRAVDRRPPHRRRQLRLGRARAGERRDRAHVHDPPELVSAPRTTCARARGCLRGAAGARAGRGHGHLAARGLRRRDDLPRRSRARDRDADRRSAGRPPSRSSSTTSSRRCCRNPRSSRTPRGRWPKATSTSTG